MGFLDALTADAYPRDSQGRRIFAPYGRRGKAYILPAERAAQFDRLSRRFFSLYFVALLLVGFLAGPWGVVAVGLLGIAAVFAATGYATRGLEVSSERPSLSREDRVERGLSAMGRPTMYAICLGGAAMAIAGASLLVRRQGNVAVWFLTVYGTVISILYGKRLSQGDETPRAT